MYPFEYLRPASLAEASAAYVTHDEASYLAGGQSLLPMMKARLAAPSLLIDLRHLTGLHDISVAGDRLTIGALAVHADVAVSSVVRTAIPALAELARSIGDMHVRSLGTIGGSLALNDPSADYPAAVLALDGEIVTDRRSITAADFFTGMMSTSLEPGELITAVRFAIPTTCSYRKFRNPASGFPMAGVMFARSPHGVRVAVTGVSAEGVFRWQYAEQGVAAGDTSLSGASLPDIAVLTDLQASTDYRLHLMRLMAQRAVAATA